MERRDFLAGTAALAALGATLAGSPESHAQVPAAADLA